MRLKVYDESEISGEAIEARSWSRQSGRSTDMTWAGQFRSRISRYALTSSQNSEPCKSWFVCIDSGRFLDHWGWRSEDSNVRREKREALKVISQQQDSHTHEKVWCQRKRRGGWRWIPQDLHFEKGEKENTDTVEILDACMRAGEPRAELGEKVHRNVPGRFKKKGIPSHQILAQFWKAREKERIARRDTMWTKERGKGAGWVPCSSGTIRWMNTWSLETDRSQFSQRH